MTSAVFVISAVDEQSDIAACAYRQPSVRVVSWETNASSPAHRFIAWLNMAGSSEREPSGQLCDERLGKHSDRLHRSAAHVCGSATWAVWLASRLMNK